MDGAQDRGGREPATRPVAWLTTLRTDGPPHTVPVWFARLDGRIWVATALASRKARNLARDPRLSLAFDGTGDHPHVAEGTAVLHRDPSRHPAPLAALGRAYGGWDAASERQRGAHGEVHDGARVLLEITVSRWLLGGP